MKEINLEEILEDHLKNFGINGFYGIKSLNREQIELIISAMKEACRKTLELATENATFDKRYVPSKVDKQSILDTINQIK